LVGDEFVEDVDFTDFASKGSDLTLISSGSEGEIDPPSSDDVVVTVVEAEIFAGFDDEVVVAVVSQSIVGDEVFAAS
jgi:hypothetical protein